ncbi:protein enhanced disease resistance 2 [Phtheirospermum japonicum]|uniref:Protein enhanced disease resistance 2 n=1 Tax=Phtheirospermum japonicum TaxID=374723 RepID=A0A830CJM5_9LAMI|nr:protein enhanced disease resistance 2 [Phtheirospermum japonicum]
MVMAGNEGKMEGWLYLIRFNRFGMQYSRKRYFFLQDHCLKSFKSIPSSETEEPVRSAIIDSCVRVIDNGRESHHRKLFFIFTLCNTSNHNDQLKLGATSSEEAAKWIRSLQEVALKPVKDLLPCSSRQYQPFSLSISKRMAKRSIDWTSASSVRVDAMTISDVISPSPWKIFGCQNGLRLFKEAKDRDSNEKHWDDTPAIMAVGVINGASEDVFLTVMDIGPSRAEWDFCFYKGSVVEHLDGHTDIIHIQLYNHWLPWAMKRRDLLIRRYWRREDDGTYGTALLRYCGGFVITPMNQEQMIDIGVANSEKEEIKSAADLKRIQNKTEDESSDKLSGDSNLTGLDDAADEFFDVPDYDLLENGWSSDTTRESCYVDTCQQKLSSAANFVKKLQGISGQRKGYVELQGVSLEESVSCCYGSTLAKDATLNVPCSWAASDPSSFLIRGDNYLVDQKKVKAKGTLMQMVAADWLRSDKREDDIAGRYGGIVQKYAARGGPEFFFVINLQVPGTTTYSLALYFMLKTPIEETPLLERFINGDDAFRNSRFKLIPHISKSVGRKACLVGQALEINYFRGKNYLELDIDVGSSTVARGVVSLVLGYLNNLVIEMAFLIQGNTEEELPEAFLDGAAAVRQEVADETDRITGKSKQISNVPIH